MVTFDERRLCSEWKESIGVFWDARNDLFLDLGGGYISVFT